MNRNPFWAIVTLGLAAVLIAKSASEEAEGDEDNSVELDGPEDAEGEEDSEDLDGVDEELAEGAEDEDDAFERARETRAKDPGFYKRLRAARKLAREE